MASTAGKGMGHGARHSAKAEGPTSRGQGIHAAKGKDQTHLNGVSGCTRACACKDVRVCFWTLFTVIYLCTVCEGCDCPCVCMHVRASMCVGMCVCGYACVWFWTTHSA